MKYNDQACDEMDKKPEITIQYFVDRGRRRTVTLSLKRLRTVLIGAVVTAVWGVSAAGFFLYHIATGYSPFSRPSRASVVSVNPDQSSRTLVGAKKPSLEEASVAQPAQVKLAAKAVPDEKKVESSAEVANPKTFEAGGAVPSAHADQTAYLAALSLYENALKDSQTKSPLKFANVQLIHEGDHLRITADIEKLNGQFVEGHVFAAAEYVTTAGKVVFVSSHGKSDWREAILPDAIGDATYFKARMRTVKRFDMVGAPLKDAKLKLVRLVARDKVSGRMIVEEVTIGAHAAGR